MDIAGDVGSLIGVYGLAVARYDPRYRGDAGGINGQIPTLARMGDKRLRLTYAGKNVPQQTTPAYSKPLRVWGHQN